jgi:bifunctional UDP-N-acetylglucosamine pyrophosphorylase/glucosamine-1-phosphate N-acetyltransferase
LSKESPIAAVILAAGRGSRMKAYEGNKTRLPLCPGETPFRGTYPMLIHIINSLPRGPKAIVVHHGKKDVMEATQSPDVSYFEQPLLNGTGGALLAARAFIEEKVRDRVIITMGDVPLVKPSTYEHLVSRLDSSHFVVLGFEPKDKKQYGLLEVDSDRVVKIVEWEYWKNYPKKRRDQLTICNSGIYAARKQDLIPYLSLLEKRPHRVRKERRGKIVEIQEFFLTDLVELMHGGGLSVAYVVSENEDEVMGVDDVASLAKVQKIFKIRQRTSETTTLSSSLTRKG